MTTVVSTPWIAKPRGVRARFDGQGRGLISHWSFRELPNASPGSFRDDIGGRHISNDNSEDIALTPWGTAGHFTNNHTATFSLPVLSRGTIVMSFVPDELLNSAMASNAYLLRTTNGSAQAGDWSAWIGKTDGNLHLTRHTGSVWITEVLSSRTSWSVGTRYTVAFTFDGQKQRLFVNGIENGTAQAYTNATNTRSLYVASYHNQTSPLNSYLLEMRLYMRALRASELREIHADPNGVWAGNIGVQTTPAGLVPITQARGAQKGAPGPIAVW